MKKVEKNTKKTVIGICGSPRNGNSLWMLKTAKKSIEESGSLLKIINLADYQINWCDGCLTCEETGSCNIKDDAEPLISEMVSSQAIMISTPIYFNSIPGKLKCFIDRLNPVLVDNKLKDKKLGVFIVGQLTGKEGEESRNDVKQFFSSFSEIFNLNLIGIVEAEGRLPNDLVSNKKIALQCERLGKKLLGS